ncbi:MAG TPA: nitroreductase family protein [Bacteroidales bacterium]|nr:nitroreductase family protein [Bacteroidales bacterium]HRZ49782.1 nitroreductase family protein [Bacteroidales bacterium]
MNETLKTLLEHRTIRQYKPDPVPEDVLNTILEAGIKASTSGNMQVYSIIVTREPARKEVLHKLHFSQQMVLDAPVLLTFCADFNRFNTWCRLRDAKPGYDNFLSFFTAAIDALLAAQNCAVAAEAFGLGICYLGTTTYQAGKLVEFFNLPDGVVPVTTLVLGYPASDPGPTDRLPAEAAVHQETYVPWTEERINKVYAEKENLPGTFKLLEENQLENLAKIFTEKRYTLKDNLYFSEVLLNVLKNQGFMNNP